MQQGKRIQKENTEITIVRRAEYKSLGEEVDIWEESMDASKSTSYVYLAPPLMVELNNTCLYPCIIFRCLCASKKE